MAETLLGQRVDAIRRLARRGHVGPLQKVVAKARAEDVAAVIEHLTAGEQRLVFAAVKDEAVAADVLSRVHGDDLLHLVTDAPAERLAALTGHLAADDQTDLLARLPDEMRAAVLALMQGEDREEVEELLAWPPDSAGGIMSPAAFTLRESSTCRDAIAAVQRASDQELVYYAYVEDEAGRLVGVASLRSLLQHPPSTKLSEIMARDILGVRPEVDQEEVARIASRYDLYAVPVVDAQGHLLGIVTIDDVVDVLREESGEDLLLMAGVRGANATLWQRVPWLLVPVIGGLGLAAGLVGAGVSAAAALFPLFVLTHASVAVQAAALAVRRLAADRHDGGVLRAVLGEAARSLVVAAALGVVGAGGCLLLRAALMPAFTAAFGGGIVISAMLGAGIPPLVRRLGGDPGLASVPLVGTVAALPGIGLWVLLAELLRVF